MKKKGKPKLNIDFKIWKGFIKKNVMCETAQKELQSLFRVRLLHKFFWCRLNSTLPTYQGGGNFSK